MGCSAFKVRNKQQVEIKRMFVLNESRKKGYAAAILTALETCATNEGFIDTIFEI